MFIDRLNMWIVIIIKMYFDLCYYNHIWAIVPSGFS